MSNTMCVSGARLQSVATIEQAALTTYVRKMIRSHKDPEQDRVGRFKETIRIAKESFTEHIAGCERCALHA